MARRSFNSAVSALGAVKAQVGAEVRVGARISGRVERLHANIKDQVVKGQVIAELDKAELQSTVRHRAADVRLARARLESVENTSPGDVRKAELEVARWQITASLAEKDRERHEALLREKLVSQKMTDESHQLQAVAQAQLRSAQTALDLIRLRTAAEREQARSGLEAAQALLAVAEIQLSYATIAAPINGVIASVSTQEGETVAAGLNAPTFVTIVDLRRLMVEAYVDEVDIGKVHLRQSVTFSVEAFPSVEFAGRVVAIYPKATIQDNVVKYVVAVEIATPYEGRLRPEMTATVAIRSDPREVLALPSKALRRESGRDFVYVAVNGRPQSREVRLGWKDGGWTEVATGLAEDEEVFLSIPGEQAAIP